MAWPSTFVAGNVLTAAQLNGIQDIGDAWTTYTVTWTASSSNPSLGNGTRAGRYLQIGQTILFTINITAGSTTTFGSGRFIFSLPVAARAASVTQHMPVGDAIAYDTSSGNDQAGLTAMFETASSVRINGVSGAVGATSPITFANGDMISIVGTYEAA